MATKPLFEVTQRKGATAIDRAGLEVVIMDKSNRTSTWYQIHAVTVRSLLHPCAAHSLLVSGGQ